MTDSVSFLGRRSLARSATLALSFLSLTLGCGGRDAWWDARPYDLEVLPLSSGCALIDPSAGQAVVYEAAGDLTLHPHTFSIGRPTRIKAVDRSRKRAFIVTGTDESLPDDAGRPALSVLEGEAPNFSTRRYLLPNLVDALALDPQGRWVALWSSESSGRLLSNPNELFLIDVEAPDTQVFRFALNSRDATTPQRVSFSPQLTLPGGPRRLLVVESQKDIHIVDLDHVRDTTPRPDVVVPLTSGGDARELTPAQVVFSDGGDATDDARIAIRIDRSSEIATVTLGSAPVGSTNDFKPTLNFTDLGGAVNDLAFVRTERGPRLAALVGSQKKAVLVDPETSATTEVDLLVPYSKMSIVTSDVPVEARGALDVVLLYGASASVGLWSLGQTVDAPWRSVDVITLQEPVQSVLDVPPPKGHLKMVQAGTRIHVLDLQRHSAAALNTTKDAALSLSPTGEFAWVYRSNYSRSLARVDLSTFALHNLQVETSADALCDVSRPGGRALVVVETDGNGRASVFDGINPSEATVRIHSSLIFSRP